MAPLSVEGIIFDVDGTLIDYEGASHTALRRPVERRGRPYSWQLHAKIIGTIPDDWSRIILAEAGIPPEELTQAQYISEYFEEIASLYSSIPAWPGCVALLEKLQSAGFPMAMATSSPRASFDKKMQHHAALVTKMAAVVTGDEVRRGKPAPDIFLEAARRLGCDPRKCIVFEDAPFGITGAHAAGCLAVALPDPRMPMNEGRFTELSPRWLLKDGIGTFDVTSISRVPPSRRGTSSAWGSRAVAAAVVVTCAAVLVFRSCASKR